MAGQCGGVCSELTEQQRFRIRSQQLPRRRLLRQALAAGVAVVALGLGWSGWQYQRLNHQGQLQTATQGVTNYSPFRVDALAPFVDDLFQWLPAMDVPLGLAVAVGVYPIIRRLTLRLPRATSRTPTSA